jgi:hypothetical protein
MIDGDFGTIVGMKIGRRNQSSGRKTAPAPLCPPQKRHDQTRDRTRDTIPAFSQTNPHSTISTCSFKTVLGFQVSGPTFCTNFSSRPLNPPSYMMINQFSSRQSDSVTHSASLLIVRTVRSKQIHDEVDGMYTNNLALDTNLLTWGANRVHMNWNSNCFLLSVYYTIKETCSIVRTVCSSERMSPLITCAPVDGFSLTTSWYGIHLEHLNSAEQIIPLLLWSPACKEPTWP